MLDYPTLRYLTLDQDADDLARLLYGPTWREAMRFPEGGTPSTRRDPLPAHLAEFLSSVLDGVAHDGRSTRDGRTRGWWLRGPDGKWSPVQLDSLGTRLHRALFEILDEAVEGRERAYSARAAAGGDSAPEAQALAYRQAAYRLALLSGLAHAVGSLGRNLSGAFAALRDRLPLSGEARRQIALTWLREALDDGDLCADNGRLLVADVKDLYEGQERSEAAPLPLKALYRALDEALGPRLRRIAWALPDEAVLEVAAVDPSQTPEGTSE